MGLKLYMVTVGVFSVINAIIKFNWPREMYDEKAKMTPTDISG